MYRRKSCEGGGACGGTGQLIDPRDKAGQVDGHRDQDVLQMGFRLSDIL
jgi:hypothetical protein